MVRGLGVVFLLIISARKGLDMSRFTLFDDALLSPFEIGRNAV